MFGKSHNHAVVNPHSSLWPFYALRRLTFWTGLVGSGIGILWSFVAGAPAATSLVGLYAALMLLNFGLIPAAILATLDVMFVRPRRLRGLPSTLAARRRVVQPLTHWAAVGGVVGGLTAVGYGIVYLNAFAPSAGFDDLLPTALLQGVAVGLAAGWLTAGKLNLVESYLPALTLSQIHKRGALLWALTVAGFGALAYFLINPTYQAAVVPAALLALTGAGIVPLHAANPPLRLAQLPPPTSPIAPSPGPAIPEGGPGEGAKGVRHPDSGPAGSTPINQPKEVLSG